MAAKKKPMTKEQVFRAIHARYGPSDLDSHVHEIMAQKASAINNDGIDSQLEFLCDEAGLDWLVEAFLSDE